MSTLKNTEKPLQNFRTAYKAFPVSIRREIKEKILHWTDWKSRRTFYEKMHGTMPMTKLESGIVEQIFMDYGVSAWTGSEIETEERITILN